VSGSTILLARVDPVMLARSYLNAVRTMHDCMNRAARAVLDGIEVAVKAKTVAWPRRYMDDKPGSEGLWNDVNVHLEAIEGESVDLLAGEV
jgi:hypothetical protein